VVEIDEFAVFPLLYICKFWKWGRHCCTLRQQPVLGFCWHQ